MDNRETALFFFRKLVYLVYLEVGALQHRVHPELANKARLNTAFFQRDKERQAAGLYLESERETATDKIVALYEDRTGLTLEEVHRAFVEGDWSNKFGAFNFGGSKWARIAELTLDLRRLVDQADWDKAAELVHEIKGLKTNQGYLINQFERTERRR